MQLNMLLKIEILNYLLFYKFNNVKNGRNYRHKSKVYVL